MPPRPVVLVADRDPSLARRMANAFHAAGWAPLALPLDPHRLWAEFDARPCALVIVDLQLIVRYGFLPLRLMARRPGAGVRAGPDGWPAPARMAAGAAAWGAKRDIPRPASPDPAGAGARRIVQAFVPPTGTDPPPAPRPAPPATRRGVVAIGASAGGPPALAAVLEALPADAPPILIAQHMPAAFTASFAARLDAACRIEVCESRPGLAVVPGRAILARGGFHLRLEGTAGRWRAAMDEDPPVNGHRPAVDPLFHSVAAVAPRSVGVVLTGMGGDGAAGLLAMRRAGARTLAQDEATSAVYGMPREAARLGAAEEILPLDRIAPRILELAGP